MLNLPVRNSSLQCLAQHAVRVVFLYLSLSLLADATSQAVLEIQIHFLEVFVTLSVANEKMEMSGFRHLSTLPQPNQLTTGRVRSDNSFFKDTKRNIPWNVQMH